MLSLDPTDLAAVTTRATYLSALFGHYASRYRFDTWAFRSFSAQIATHGSISGGYLEDLTAEVPATVVARCIDLPSPPSSTSGCGGKGYHWVYDTDYPCSGCYACRSPRDPWVIVAWWIGVMAWGLATAHERARLQRGVLAMQALASIGVAIEAALSPGRGVSTWLTAAMQEWNEVRVGRWYRVAGRRGRAKEHHGAEGEVMRLEHAPGRFGSLGTLRAALRLPGEAKWAWVPAGSLESIRTPVEAVREQRSKEQLAAARASRPCFSGSKGDAVYIIDGPDVGKNGAVMWMGPGRDGPRVGVRFGVGEKDIAWCDARDVVDQTGLVDATHGSRPTQHEEELMAAAVIGGDDLARIVLGDSLEQRGFEELAAAWRGPIPVAQPRGAPRYSSKIVARRRSQ